VPNIGEEITDYDEYKGSSTLMLPDSSTDSAAYNERQDG